MTAPEVLPVRRNLSQQHALKLGWFAPASAGFKVSAPVYTSLLLENGSGGSLHLSHHCGAPAMIRRTGMSHASGSATNHRKMFKSAPSDRPSIGRRKMIPSKIRKPNRSSFANGLARALGKMLKTTRPPSRGGRGKQVEDRKD